MLSSLPEQLRLLSEQVGLLGEQLMSPYPSSHDLLDRSKYLASKSLLSVARQGRRVPLAASLRRRLLLHERLCGEHRGPPAARVRPPQLHGATLRPQLRVGGRRAPNAPRLRTPISRLVTADCPVLSAL